MKFIASIVLALSLTSGVVSARDSHDSPGPKSPRDQCFADCGPGVGGDLLCLFARDPVQCLRDRADKANQCKRDCDRQFPQVFQ